MTEFNVAEIQEALAAVVGHRAAVVQGTRRLSWAEFTERTRRLANYLHLRGLGLRRERSSLAGHESGQDHLALYLHNCPEYLEGLFGAFKARLTSFNVNYRYTPAELRQLFGDAQPRAVVYHAMYAERLAEVLRAVPGLEVLLQVDDGSGAPLLPGAIPYEAALAQAPADRPDLDWSPDDLYLLYTGGTTGLPKGVLWRQADVLVRLFGVRNQRDRRDWESLDELVAHVAARPGRRTLPGPPLMHGSGQWPACEALLSGGTVVLAPHGPGLNSDALWQAIDDEDVDRLVIVGEAFARPMLDALQRRPGPPRSLRTIVSGGAALSGPTREQLAAALPGTTIVESMGSSESGPQARIRNDKDTTPATGTFHPYPGTYVIDGERTRILEPGDRALGWIANTGRIPLGYLNDATKTAQTFPVVDGMRMAVPGDRARYSAGGLIEVLGRDSVTINSGGEKIFAEEVEAAILAHPAVADAMVVGRPSPRWGNEVVAVVSLRPGEAVTADELQAAAAERVARYKVPKQIVIVDRVERGPAGKADYRWAREVALRADAGVPTLSGR